MAAHGISYASLNHLRENTWLNTSIIDGYFQRLEHIHNRLHPSSPIHFFSCNLYTSLLRDSPLNESDVLRLFRDGLDPFTYTASHPIPTPPAPSVEV